MPDREKVIAWLADEELYYRDHGDLHNSKMACDALSMLKDQEEEIENLKQTAQSRMEGICLLKEQEAVEPRRIDGKRNHFNKCGNCNYDLMTGFQFCPHCGRKVKWDD